ncbi:MAG: hypothetical protein AB7I19_06230 [Planctomycetota bacterium]
MTTSSPRPHRHISLGDRFSDRLNPILVREINQALGSRTVTRLLTSACLMILVLAIVYSATTRHSAGSSGRMLLVISLGGLFTFLLFPLPRAAFRGARQDVAGPTADQLRLTRMRPWQIVRGRLGASLLLTAMFVSVFAPLIATSYLHNGVDVPTILLLLYTVVLVSLLMAAGSIALGSVSIQSRLQQIGQVLLVVGTVWLSMGMVFSGNDVVDLVGNVLRDPRRWWLILAWTITFLCATAFCGIAAAANFTLPVENRSTSFRVYAVVVLALVTPWLWMFDPEFDANLVSVATVFGAAFPGVLAVWAAAETPNAPGPARHVRFRLLSPFCPGGNRGLAYAWVLIGIALGLFFLGRSVGSGDPGNGGRRAAITAWCYVGILASLARGLRAALPRAKTGDLAFLCLVMTVFASLIVMLFNLLSDSPLHWHVGHAVNPAFAVAAAFSDDEPMQVAVIIAGMCFVGGLPTMLRGFAGPVAVDPADRAGIA